MKRQRTPVAPVALAEDTSAVTPSAPPAETALVLRTCKSDMSSSHGFVWPESGSVAAPDWDPAPFCGQGLHGLLWGCGDGGLLDWSETARWLVVEIDPATAVDLQGKVKFPRGNVVYCGDRSGATTYIHEHGGAGRPIVGVIATAGDRGTATAGYAGTATAGDRGTATAGDRGTATAGDRGTATAGYAGTATAGYAGTATAGYAGTATAGDRGTATAGENGIILFRWWDGARYRIAVGYVGEDGIEAGKSYRLGERGAFVLAK